MTERTRAIVSHHRRAAILRMLHEQSDFRLNDRVLQDALEAVALTASRDLVNTELAWLEEQGLLSLESIDGITVAKLTQRGVDCANGSAVVPGVKRPGPRE